MLWLVVNERIHVNILEALRLATLAHLCLLHHRLKLLIWMRIKLLDLMLGSLLF